MDLDKLEVLKMTAKTTGGDDCLFIEAGGFQEKYGPDWKTPLMVSCTTSPRLRSPREIGWSSCDVRSWPSSGRSGATWP